jgi:hypothetical protein
MAIKFNRGYKLFIAKQDGSTVLIDSTVSPFTLDFDIQRANFASTNLASIKISNLGPVTRQWIWKGPGDLNFDRKMWLYGGYGENSQNFPLIFKGSIKQAWSFREGSTFTTQIESFDGGDGAINALTTGLAVGTTTSYYSLATQLITSLGQYGITQGVIGPMVAQLGNFPAPKTFDDYTWKLLNENFSGFSVDLETAYILSQTVNSKTGIITYESLKNTPVEISAAIGLLGTPLTEGPNTLTCQIIFAPQFQVYQLVHLQTTTAKYLNGIYRVNSVKHRGNISPTVGGQAITTLGLLSSTPIR